MEQPKAILVARIYLAIYLAAIGLTVYLGSILPLLLIGLPRLCGAWHHVLTGLSPAWRPYRQRHRSPAEQPHGAVGQRSKQGGIAWGREPEEEASKDNHAQLCFDGNCKIDARHRRRHFRLSGGAGLQHNIIDSSQFDDLGTGKFFMRVSVISEEGVGRAPLEVGLWPDAANFGMETALRDQAERMKVLLMG